MEINLNKPFTTNDVRKLLASKDDNQSRQLRVTTAGKAYLSDDIGNINTEGHAFVVDTWDAGNGYTGEAAAKDPKWVARVERVLRDNWPNPTNAHIDFL